MIFTKVRDVKSPSRANPYDAGMDFYIPEYSQDLVEKIKSNDVFVDQDNTIVIKPHGRILIPSGIKVRVDKNTALIAGNKSGVAVKKGLLFGAHVIDFSYRGEVHINLVNTNDHEVCLEFGDKIIQFIQFDIKHEQPQELSNELYDKFLDVDNELSTRGDGGFGSTGVK